MKPVYDPKEIRNKTKFTEDYLRMYNVSIPRARACAQVAAPRKVVRAAAGFTLVELLIALLVISILTAVAVFSYRHEMTSSSIKVGQAALLQQAQDLAQFAQDHETYAGGCSQPVSATDWQISCTSLTQTGFTIVATGSGAAAGFQFTLDQSGARATPAAPSGWPTSTSCWITDSSGDCANG